MNFQQLRIIRETIRHNFNLTEVANALYTSQSGVSKHIKDIEEELGVELFVRRGKRLLGLTEPGKEMVSIVDRMLLDAKNIRQLAEQFANSEEGELTVVTTHTHARYVLPSVVTDFNKLFPRVRLVLRQAMPKEIVPMLLDGDADIGVAAEGLEDHADIIALPHCSWDHAVIVASGHPLEEMHRVTLEAIADWPIVTYDPGFTGRPVIDQSFAQAGIAPDIVMTALDADVIKAYVRANFGVGIIASIAYDPDRDSGLSLVQTAELFAPITSHIAVRQSRYLRGYAYRFLELCSPDLTQSFVRASIRPAGDHEIVG